MLFAGIQKLTLLDYPQHVACTLFTQGCGYRCPFCHNSSLLPLGTPEQPMTEEAVLAFLKKRQGTLDGVCFTGGEPLMQDDLPAFIGRVRELGFLIKLDTNGSQPERLRALIGAGVSREFLMKLGLEYRFITRYLDGDFSSEREMLDLLATAIKQFAKRQMIWFRRDPDIRWLDLSGDYKAEAMALTAAFLEK